MCSGTGMVVEEERGCACAVSAGELGCTYLELRQQHVCRCALLSIPWFQGSESALAARLLALLYSIHACLCVRTRLCGCACV